MKKMRPECRCDACGYSWTTRKTVVSQRRCPECGRRTVSIVPEKTEPSTASAAGAPAENVPQLVEAMKQTMLAELKAQEVRITEKMDLQLKQMKTVFDARLSNLEMRMTIMDAGVRDIKAMLERLQVPTAQHAQRIYEAVEVSKQPPRT